MEATAKTNSNSNPPKEIKHREIEREKAGGRGGRGTIVAGGRGKKVPVTGGSRTSRVRPPKVRSSQSTTEQQQNTSDTPSNEGWESVTTISKSRISSSTPPSTSSPPTISQNDQLNKQENKPLTPNLSPTTPFKARQPSIIKGSPPPSFIPAIGKQSQIDPTPTIDLATLKALTSLRALNICLEDLGVSDALKRRSAIAQLVGYDGYSDVTKERLNEWWQKNGCHFVSGTSSFSQTTTKTTPPLSNGSQVPTTIPMLSSSLSRPLISMEPIRTASASRPVSDHTPPARRKSGLNHLKGTIRRSLSFKSTSDTSPVQDSENTLPPSSSSSSLSNKNLQEDEGEVRVERRKSSSVFSNIPKLFSPVRRKTESITPPPPGSQEDASSLAELQLMSSNLKEVTSTPEKEPAKPPPTSEELAPTVGAEVLEALSEHWLDDVARGEAWLRQRQVEELREAIGDNALSLDSIENDYHTWCERTTVAKNAMTDLSSIFGILSSVVAECKTMSDVENELNCEDELSEVPSLLQNLINLDDDIELWMEEGNIEKSNLFTTTEFLQIEFQEWYMKWLEQFSSIHKQIIQYFNQVNNKKVNKVDDEEEEQEEENKTDLKNIIKNILSELLILISNIKIFQTSFIKIIDEFIKIENIFSNLMEKQAKDGNRMKFELQSLEVDNEDSIIAQMDEYHHSSSDNEDDNDEDDDDDDGTKEEIETETNGGEKIVRETNKEENDDITDEVLRKRSSEQPSFTNSENSRKKGESETSPAPKAVKFKVSAAEVACPAGHSLRPYTSPRDSMVCQGPCGGFLKTGAPFRGCKTCSFSQCLKCCEKARRAPLSPPKPTPLHADDQSSSSHIPPTTSKTPISSQESDISPALDSLLELIGLPPLPHHTEGHQPEARQSLGFSDTIATFFSPTPSTPNVPSQTSNNENDNNYDDDENDENVVEVDDDNDSDYYLDHQSSSEMNNDDSLNEGDNYIDDMQGNKGSGEEEQTRNQQDENDSERRPSAVASLEADVKAVAENIGGLFSSFSMSASGAVAGLFGSEEPVSTPSPNSKTKRAASFTEGSVFSSSSTSSSPAPRPTSHGKDTKHQFHKSNSLNGPAQRGRSAINRRNQPCSSSSSSIPSNPSSTRNGVRGPNHSHRSSSPRSRIRSANSLGTSNNSNHHHPPHHPPHPPSSNSNHHSSHQPMTRSTTKRPMKQDQNSSSPKHHLPPQISSSSNAAISLPTTSNLTTTAAQRGRQPKHRATVGAEPARRRSSGFSSLLMRSSNSFGLSKTKQPMNSSNNQQKQAATGRRTLTPTSSSSSLLSSKKPLSKPASFNERSKDVAELGGLLAKRGTLTPAETKRVQSLMRRNSEMGTMRSVSDPTTAKRTTNGHHQNDEDDDEESDGDDSDDCIEEVEVDAGEVVDMSFLEALADT